jgi:hypothetical protein
MDGNDVRMVQRGDRQRLAPESLAALRIAGRGIRQGFQRDLALQPEMARPVDLAHSTEAQY